MNNVEDCDISYSDLTSEQVVLDYQIFSKNIKLATRPIRTITKLVMECIIVSFHK